MSKIRKDSSIDVGLPPGTLVHVGKKKVEKAKISIFTYNETDYKEMEATSVEKCFPYKDRPEIIWINIDGIHEVEIVEKLGKCFNLHPLTLEDILNTEQRPKMEDFEDYLFVVLRMISGNEKYKIYSEQISIVFGSNFVISFQESETDIYEGVRKRIRSGKGRIRKMGSDYLAYALVDAIVDHYFVVLELYGERFEELASEELVANPDPENLRSIHDLKREMIYLRRSVWPLREVVNNLTRGESNMIKDSTKIFLKDVYDHTVQIIDTIETDRDILTGMLDLYLSSISNKLNEVMKVLTIISTIFIPMTFITGIYGMNFLFMPELGWRWAYPAVWLIMIFVAASMFLFFKRIKWV
jgi:magnesium transporter